jgi:hypothetical protein
VAADGFHEYLGYDYVPCHCAAALKWVGKLGPSVPTTPPASVEDD